MGKDDLHKLLSAERKAQQIVEKVRDRAKLEIKKAEDDAREQREIRMVEFDTLRTTSLKEVKDEAHIEAERIRNDGILMANDLRNKAKGRISVAVEKVLALVKES